MDVKRDGKRDICVAHRASRVDVKKLEKQEAKLKVWGSYLFGGMDG